MDPEMASGAEGFECAECGEPLNELAVAQGDPFCTVACCNTWHGFEPLSRIYTLSGHPADEPRESVSKWDDGARHKRRRKTA